MNYHTYHTQAYKSDSSTLNNEKRGWQGTNRYNYRQRAIKKTRRVLQEKLFRSTFFNYREGSRRVFGGKKIMVKEGYILDFISKQEVKATPEETEAVQIFSKQLVEDYGYKKEFIQTRPQFRVRARPSDTKKEYPVDIAVFQSKDKDEEQIYIIVECKKKNRKEGRKQLEDYLRFSKATLGVWFNGDERLFLRKIESDGKVLFEEIPNIPKFGQRIEDLGKFRRADLKPTHNLKAVFKSIRNHLAGNTVGATRDEVLAQQLINLIFCKIYDEKFTKPDEIIEFRAGIEESGEEIKNRIFRIFENVKSKYKEVIAFNEEIDLDSSSVAYVVGELQNYSLIDTERDVISDAFEIFIGHALKGGQGQFFTPRNVIQMMVEILAPKEDEMIIDPACGSGGFLIDSLRYVWRNIDKKAKEYDWNEREMSSEKLRVASENFRGIDKDYFLSKVTKAYMAVMGDGKGGIFCEDSLEKPSNWNQRTRAKIQLGSFDVVLTNPPFGSKIPVKGEEKLKQFELGHKWKFNKERNAWDKENKLKDKEAPQVLFIERCLDFLKEGGRMGIVLPDGIYGNGQLGYIRQFLIKKAQILAVIDVPKETFMPNTSTKTSILFLRKLKKDEKIIEYPIFMAICDKCGHDRRGNSTPEDDIKEIASKFYNWKDKNGIEY
jgi:type I restriction enzyme M protein